MNGQRRLPLLLNITFAFVVFGIASCTATAAPIYAPVFGGPTVTITGGALVTNTLGAANPAITVTGSLDFTPNVNSTSVNITIETTRMFTVGAVETDEDTIFISGQFWTNQLNPTSSLDQFLGTTSVVGIPNSVISTQAPGLSKALPSSPAPGSGVARPPANALAAVGPLASSAAFALLPNTNYTLDQVVKLSFSSLSTGEVVREDFPLVSTIVPEPSSVAMFAAGIIALLVYRRRGRKRV